jgi:hypothetical protein
MALVAVRDDQRDGERRERKDGHRVGDEPDGGKVAPTVAKLARAEREEKENIPELPADGISSIFELVGGLDLQITAVVVVCG